MDRKHIVVWLLVLFVAAMPNTVWATEKIMGISVLASSNANATLVAGSVLDGNPATIWNAGVNAPGWILLDLKKNSTVNQLFLTLAQSQKGRTVYQIDAGATQNELVSLITIDQITSDNQVIRVPLVKPVANIRYIKITTVQSPSPVAWREIEVYSGTDYANTHVQYYGYMSYDGLIQQPAATYFPEMDSLANTNIAWVFNSPNVEEFATHGMKSLITALRWYFFTGGELRADWQVKWQQFRDALKGKEQYVYGFYFDEPVWVGYSKDAFLTATKAIHDAYPDKAILVVEAEPPISQGTIPAEYYQYVTDIGFDYYFTMFYGDNAAGWGKYLDIWEKFKPYAINKKIWLIADGYGNSNAQWADAYERYLSYALTNDSVVGILGFIYQNPAWSNTLRPLLLPGEPNYNAAFRARQIEIGKAILPKITATPTPTPVVGDADGDKQVNGVDYVVWLTHYNMHVFGATNGDFNNDGNVNGIDYVIWINHYNG